MENVPFYNLKRPYFHFMYLESGQKKFREENFSLTLGHNISPTTGFNVNYRSRGTKAFTSGPVPRTTTFRLPFRTRESVIRCMPDSSTTT